MFEGELAINSQGKESRNIDSADSPRLSAQSTAVPATQDPRPLALLGVTVALIGLCILLAWPYLSAITWSIALAIIAWPMHRQVTKWVSKPVLAALISTTIVTGVIAGCFAFVTYQIAHESAAAAEMLTENPNGSIRATIEETPLLNRVVVWMDRVGLDLETEIRKMAGQYTQDLTGLAQGEDVIAPDEEISRLVGMSLWDIFSDSHDVLDEDGREVSLGSFRASAGFLADQLNEQVKAGLVQGPAIDAATRAEEVQKAMRAAMPEMNNDLLFQFMKEHQTGPYDYMDFYLGTRNIAQRADLGPVYRMIFTRLKALDLDWKYTFPRLYLVDMRPLKEHLDAQKAEESGGEPEWAGYNPEEELAKDEANREKDRELAEMRESLDDDYREAVAAALKGPPPLIVQSYREVFGEWPAGWPPTA